MNETVFNNRIKLLEYDNGIEAIEEFIHTRLGERERSANLHETIARKGFVALATGSASHGSRLFCRMLKNRERLFRIRDRHAAARDADLRRRAVVFNGVETRKVFRRQTARRLGSACARELIGDLRQSIVDFFMTAICSRRENNPSRIVFRETFHGDALRFFRHIDER